MKNSEHSHTGPERRVQIDECDGAPTKFARELLNGRYDRTSSLFCNRFSQTPLTPLGLSENGKPYMDAAEQVLWDRLDARADEVELSDEYRALLWHEILVEHNRRASGNTRAAHRLLASLGLQESLDDDIELSDDEAQLVWRALIGEASMRETGDLLLRFPGMQSIEAAKYTQPLDANAGRDVNRYIMHQLGAYVNQEGITMMIYGNHDGRRDRRWMKEIPAPEVPAFVMGSKENVAEVSKDGRTIQLVRKDTIIAFPTSVELKDVKPQIVRTGNVDSNCQPIAFSFYWRSLPVIPHAA